MMDLLSAFLHSAALHHAVVALVAVAAVDIRAWKSWGDVAFNWKTASYRWVSAAIFGALTSLGMN